MSTVNHAPVVEEEVVVVQAAPVHMVREAAEAAADVYAPDEVEKHAQAIADAWEARLREQTKVYTRRVRALAREAGPEATGPISQFQSGEYLWWNLLLAGPYQRTDPDGPYQPAKIIRHGEWAFMLVALWRNTEPLGIAGPPASQVMAPYEYEVWLETTNITDCANGPDYGPITGTFGGGNTNVFWVRLRPSDFPEPSQGKPTLYEMNMVVDIKGPGPGLPPFAGYATWVYDPDSELPFGPVRVWIPGVGWVLMNIPGRSARLQHDIPARFLVYV